MLFIGGYWADDGREREYCYKIIPQDIANDPRAMTLNGFDRVWGVLGQLGYRFRDAGHNHNYVKVSLSRPITSGHLKQLEGDFLITPDSGEELAFV